MNMAVEEIKSKIRKYAMEMGIDDVGFANVVNYFSPQSPRIDTIFPEAKSMIVLAFKETSSCDSPSNPICMSGRMDLMEFSRSCSYKINRFLDREFKVRAMSVPMSYPLDMSAKSMGLIGEVSLRHAAQAAGLGTFGRHNLIIHPRFGTRVMFAAILSELDLPSDTPITEDLCINCDICVENCPAGALNEKGRTDKLKCLRVSQPHGIGGRLLSGVDLPKALPKSKRRCFTAKSS